MYHATIFLFQSHSMCYIVLKLLFTAVQLILNCTVIIAYIIATFSNCMLNLPVKMHGYGSHLRKTSYTTYSNNQQMKSHHTWMIEMHGDG